MICGAPGFNSGDGHLCPEHGGRPPAAVTRPGPPVLWPVLTWGFVTLSAVYVTLLLAGVASRAAAAGAAGDRIVVDAALLVGVLSFVWFWVYVAGLVSWRVSSRRSAERLGYDRKEILGHWTFPVGWIGFVLIAVASGFAASSAVPGEDAFAGDSAATLVLVMLRIGMIGVLVAYAIVVWRRLSRAA